MRIITALCISLLVIVAAAGALAGDKVYGEGLTGEETIVASELLANPDKYVGQTVRVQGTAVGVCAHRGCWISIAGDEEGQTVRVKVKDGEIVFPPEIVGETVIAEGVWTANELTMAQTKKMCAASARREGKEFTEGEVTTCMTTYQISGTGAVVVAAAE